MKTKGAVSSVVTAQVTAQLICTFVFAYEKKQVSQDIQLTFDYFDVATYNSVQDVGTTVLHLGNLLTVTIHENVSCSFPLALIF